MKGMFIDYSIYYLRNIIPVDSHDVLQDGPISSEGGVSGDVGEHFHDGGVQILLCVVMRPISMLILYDSQFTGNSTLHFKTCR